MSPGSVSIDKINGPGGEDAATLIGRELRAARQRRGEDLYDVAELLRIKPSYLFALEEGDHGTMPGLPYLSGFLRSYADHLGLDGQRLVRRLKAGRPASMEGTTGMRPMPVPREERRPLLVAVLAALVLAGSGYGGWSYLSSQISTPVDIVDEEPPSPPPVVVTTPQPTELAIVPAPVAPEPSAQPETSLAAVDAPSPPADAVAVVEGGAFQAGGATEVAIGISPAQPAAVAQAPAPPVADERPAMGVGAAIASEARVVLVATEPAWIQIRSADRQFSRSRLMEAGERFLLPERTDLALWTGNAGGLQVMVDGIELAPLGARGAVLKNIPLDPAALKARSVPR
ncbi:helix-turn-helix domain-containing protein [Geminicoccus roseus]|uniref:helix-turn-helix domain-containing protein n=1 Tax=Geminicoccus roseus TaxID=404900 RepID=UPI0004066D26|nr:helix-turn-helix domain-containing protein [Geminicoccus roseus]